VHIRKTWRKMETAWWYRIRGREKGNLRRRKRLKIEWFGHRCRGPVEPPSPLQKLNPSTKITAFHFLTSKLLLANMVIIIR
jgi:hypothetical protein